DALRTRRDETRVAGIVGVRLEQRGAAAAERAVRPQLDGTDPQTLEQRELRAAPQERLQRRVVSANHDVVAQRVASLAGEVLVHCDRLGADAGIVDARQSPTIRLRDRRESLLPQLGARRGW